MGVLRDFDRELSYADFQRFSDLHVFERKDMNFLRGNFHYKKKDIESQEGKFPRQGDTLLDVAVRERLGLRRSGHEIFEPP